MGAVRKTGSVLTLGRIPFRSRAEQLMRAEARLGQAEASLALATERASRARQRADTADERAQAITNTMRHDRSRWRRRR